MTCRRTNLLVPQTGGAKRVAVVIVLLLLLLLLLMVLVMSAATRSAGPSRAPRPSAERIGVAGGPPCPRSRNGDRLLLLLLPTLLPEGGADVLVVADEGVHRISRAPGRLLLALGALEPWNVTVTLIGAAALGNVGPF